MKKKHCLTHYSAIRCLMGLLFLVLFFVGAVPLYSQNSMTVKGQVIAASDNMPLVGVSVVQKGTTNGITTDIDGNFSLNIPVNETLVFSYVGFLKQEVVVSQNKTTYNIILQEDSHLIDEIVVVGYGVQKKKLVTGATIQVKGENIAKMNTVSPLTALQSMTPGVNITKTSGQPGESFKVVIRGIGTVHDSKPLYIVDGVTRGNIDYLNPNDIESIDILKDAASAAIYGARAANGVIIVTTKKGFEGKASIQYDGYYGIQKVAKRARALGAKDFAMLLQEGQANDKAQPIDFESLLAPGDWQRIQNGKWDGTNWLKEMENDNAPIQSHSLTLSGGTSSSIYSIGGSLTTQEGIYGKPVQSDYKRYTFRVNTEHSIIKTRNLDILKVGENLTYSYTEKKGIATGGVYSNNISQALRTAPFLPLWAKDANGNDIIGEYHKTIPFDAKMVNPIGRMVYHNGSNISKSHNLNGNVYAILQPIKNLRYRTSFGYNLGASGYRSFIPVYDLGDGSPFLENEVHQSLSTGFDWTFENTLSYNFTVNEKHSVDALIGASAERTGLGDNVNGTNSNSVFEDFEHGYLDNTNVILEGRTRVGGSPWQKGGILSYFGRVNYNYMEKYMATVVLRADGSSNFAKGNRWGYFPSLSAGWVITNESFMEPTKRWMDFFKLRASWGQNGNQSIPGFRYLPTISFYDNDYYFGPDKAQKWPGAYPEYIANPNLKWETSQQLDLGFDALFLNSRLNVAFDWYEKKTKDWLVRAPVLGSYGTGAPFINGGDIMNKGIELAIGWRDQIKDFSYSATFNVSYNKNEVTRIENSEGIINSYAQLSGGGTFARAQVGYPIGYFYGYKTDGIFQTEDEVKNYKNSEGKVILPNAVPGDVRFKDLNDDGVIDDKDKTQIGKSNPDWNVGLNINLGYKGFDLLISGHGVLGNDIFKSYRMPDSQRQNYTSDMLGRWHGEGTSNRLPRMSSGAHINTLYVSDLYVEDGSYWRFSNITLGYDFKKIFKSLPLQQLRLYVTAENLFTITSYSGMDPEIGTSTADSWVNGVDFGFYPSPKIFMIGTSIKF